MGITQEQAIQIIKSIGMPMPKTGIKRVTFFTNDGGMFYVNIESEENGDGKGGKGRVSVQSYSTR